MNTGAAGIDGAVVYDSRHRRTLADVWRARELLFRLIERNLMVKYQRSVLGFVWTLFNPLLTVGILIAVFSHVVRIDIHHYWAFLLSGYFVFNFSLQMLGTGSRVLIDHAQMTKTSAFPAEVLVFATALSRLIEFAVAMLLVVGALVIFHHGTIPFSFGLLPLLVLLLLLTAIGVVLPLAVASVFFYDIEHALPVLTMILFYISPVFYPAEMVPDFVRPFFYLNPLAALLNLFHTVLYEGAMPAPGILAASTAGAVLLFVGGYAIFDRYRALCAEVV